MASIIKRRNKFSVVYRFVDENGVQRQRWETFNTNAEAKKRKSEVEFQQDSGTFIVPTAKTLDDLLREYMSIYGVNTWAMSTYESHKALITNYISPIIGDMKLDDINTRVMDQYFQSLQKVKSVTSRYVHAKNEYLSVHIIREVFKLLRNAFNQAVKWEMMSRNPVVNCTIPKEEHEKREIWTAETLFKALEVCDDDIIALAINLAFSCSLRMGELLALTWDCIDITQQSIDEGHANIYVNKELQRVSRSALEALNGKDVIKKFPPALASTNTSLVLKQPKTKTSVRRIYLPKTVAEMLRKRKASLDEMKDLFGDEYLDYDLVFCSSNGHPLEASYINRGFSKLIRENGLPKVVFHSLRHSSITYKLKLNGGDMKSVQGDSGHAQMRMIEDVYSHILDEDRATNAQRFEAEFYSKSEAPEAHAASAAPASELTDSDKAKFIQLLSNPEFATLIKSFVGSV
ncbi:MAG TPA: site-specific integrase [Alphaproteobacteria bacterium]|jgi:integrase|nr:site-specific integrase [Alphaproteobacteria bacterium]